MSKQIKAGSGQPTSLFQCGSCKTSFARLDHLSRHVRSHTNDRPHQCNICNKSFGRIDLLKRHVEAHFSSSRGRNRKRVKHGDSTNNAPRVRQSCLTCAEAHLKCTEQKPCVRCLQKGIVCQYEVDHHLQQHDAEQQSDAAVTTQSDDTTLYEPTASNAHSVASNEHDEANHLVSRCLDAIPRTDVTTNPTQTSQDDLASFLQNIMPQAVSPFTMSGFDAAMPGTITPGPAFAFETDLQLDDADLGCLDSYNNDIPFSFGFGSLYSSPVATVTDITIHDTRDNTTDEMPPSNNYRDKYWRFRPQKGHTGHSDEKDLASAGEVRNGLSPEARIKLPLRMPVKQLNARSRDRMLVMVMNACKEENLARVVASFPSLELLDVLFQFCLSSPIARADTFLHVTTMDPNECRPELLAAMISWGAVLTADPALSKLGLAIQESVRHFVPLAWENDNRLTRDLELTQAFLISLEVGIWSGNSRKMEIAESFLLPLLTMVRRDNKCKANSYIPIVVESGDQGAALQNKWLEWRKMEMSKRLVLRLLHHDRATSMSFMATPLISCAELQMPLPAKKEIWLASSGEQWKELYISGDPDSKTPSILDCIADPDRYHRCDAPIDQGVAYLATIEGMWNLVWDYIQSASMQTVRSRHWNPLVLQSRYDELSKLLDNFSAALDTSHDRSEDSKLMLETMLLHLHVPLQEIEMLAGVEGESEAKVVYQKLVEWQQTTTARNGLLHACQILRMARTTARGFIQGFWNISLYHAALTCWAYGVLSGSDRMRDDQLEQASPSPRVYLDSDPSKDTFKFVEFGRYIPCITSNTGIPILLQDTGAVLGVFVSTVQNNHCHHDMPLLATNVTQLLRGTLPLNKQSFSLEKS